MVAHSSWISAENYPRELITHGNPDSKIYGGIHHRSPPG